MGIPAGLFMKRFGYQKGIIFGLLLYAFGAFLFFPATYVQTFQFTLLCLFVIECGLTFLETAANPYATVLGPKQSAAQRINLSQSFNGLGWMIGPTVGGLLILGNTSGGENMFSSMALPYMIVGSFVLLVALLFILTKLPEINEEEGEHNEVAVIAQFFYVAAQTGINSFFINYVTETMPTITPERAAYMLSVGFSSFGSDGCRVASL